MGTLSKAVAVLFLLCSAAFGSDFTNAVVNFSGCSGTIISKGTEHAMILSAAHCFEMGGVHTFWHDGGSYTAKVVDIDAKSDLALLRTTTPHGINAVAPVSKNSGQWPYTAAGFSRGSKLQLKLLSGGKSNQRYNATKGVWDNFFNVEKGYFEGGDSGGGLFNNRGKLVGVITHSEENCGPHGCTELYATKQTRIFRFLRRNRGRHSGCGDYCTVPEEPSPEVPPYRKPGLNNGKDQSSELDALRKQVALLAEEIDRMKSQKAPPAPSPEEGPKGERGLAGVKGDPGSNGARGDVGQQGLAGVIRVEIIRDGRVDRVVNGVVSGSTVRVKISDKE